MFEVKGEIMENKPYIGYLCDTDRLLSTRYEPVKNP